MCQDKSLFVMFWLLYSMCGSAYSDHKAIIICSNHKASFASSGHHRADEFEFFLP